MARKTERVLHLSGQWPRRGPRRGLLWLFVALLPCVAGARATAPVCALLAEARVTGASIYLSDLLPPETSPELRAAAARISLGAAPPPGSSLTLEGPRIAQLLPAAARGALRIPAHVLVHRASRPLTREEVFRAIQDSLRYNKFPGAEALAPEDVHFSAGVLVSARDAQLHVRRADFDAALHQDRFLLISQADPRALPFLVTVERPAAPQGNSGDNAAEQPAESGDLARALRAAPSARDSSREILVDPKRRAKLHVVSGSMQMFLEVVPLEKGALQDLVRVKLPGNGQILRGRVIAPGQLEAQF